MLAQVDGNGSEETGRVKPGTIEEDAVSAPTSGLGLWFRRSMNCVNCL